MVNRRSPDIGVHGPLGPNWHAVGCALEEGVFIATGAATFNGKDVVVAQAVI
jgi:carbonic anhydrase/acetyltransferase-like protein (isoleucine patch superfamily)